MKKYLVEFIGTFFLIFTICGVVVNLQDVSSHFAPIAIGCVLIAMVYAGGYISGGMYNPAVSLAVFIRGKMSFMDMIIYWVAQCAGGAFAGFAARHMYYKWTGTPANFEPMWGLLAEGLGTFALCYVVLNVATSNKTSGNSYYGLAIGFTVLAMAYVFGPVSGGAFNPAVALGLSIFHLFEYSSIWIYLSGAFAGAILAGIIYRIVSTDNDPV